MIGKIIKGVGGFYYIHLNEQDINASQLYECKAKGAFRNQGIKPAVGDDVEIEIIDEEKYIGNIVRICRRNNLLIRPAVANVDQAIIIFALAQPEPNYNLLDRFLLMMDRQDVKTIIVFNKADLIGEDKLCEIKDIYEKCGYKVFVTSTYNREDVGICALRKQIIGKTSVFAGPSGVGKSSLLNALNPSAGAVTGEISEKIKRGKHTTRHSQLMYVDKNTYIMDTPGFSSLDVIDIMPFDLKDYYNEFLEYSSECRFNGCIHINEPDCRVKKAVAEGNISELRYNNYKQLYEELKEKRKW